VLRHGKHDSRCTDS